MKTAQGIMMDRWMAVNGKKAHRSSTGLNGIKIPQGSHMRMQGFSLLFALTMTYIHTYIHTKMKSLTALNNLFASSWP